MAKTRVHKPSKDPEVRGDSLAEELDATLRGEFPDRKDYREAVETVITWLGAVIMGLDDDDKNGGGESGPQGYGHGI